MLTHNPSDLSKRHIPLTGATNFRDLGGYMGHEGRLFNGEKFSGQTTWRHWMKTIFAN